MRLRASLSHSFPDAIFKVMFLEIELCLTLVGVAIAFIHPHIAERGFARLEGQMGILARRRFLSICLVGLLSLGLRLALLPVLPIPQPGVQDEFSHLLLADTLVHGRLANPTHPMWVHFETFHENWRPTYTSMYFPGQALFLALGQVIFGHPFWGVWLSAGLMCAAICWALQEWISPEWALLGGFLVVLRIGTLSYWANGYWGGAVPATGGALVLGALPRIRRENSLQNAALFGLGTALLLTTRPYESIFFLLPFAVVVAGWLLRAEIGTVASRIIKTFTPITAILAIAAAGLGYYFWRVTGSPWTTPYSINIHNYGLLYFPWDKVRDITYHHAIFREFYRDGAVLGMYGFARQHPLELLLAKVATIWLFFFGPSLTVPLIAAFGIRGFTRLSWRTKFLVACSLTTFISLALIIHVGHPHYLAALTAVFYSMLLLSMRSFWVWQWQGRPTGKSLVRIVPVICVLMFLARAAAPLMHFPVQPSNIRTWCSVDHQNLRRAAVLKKLECTPGNHLVIVRYKPDHDFITDDWVFNDADIDDSRVIWARDMGVQNAELIQYFTGRTVWLLEPDYNPPRLTNYAE